MSSLNPGSMSNALALALRKRMPGGEGKAAANIYQILAGIILGAGSVVMIDGGRIEIQSLTGPFIITKGSADSARAEVLFALAKPAHQDRLSPGEAAVCNDSPLLGRTISVLTPEMDDGVTVAARRYVPCSKEESSREILILHPDDMRRMFKGVILGDEPRKVRVDHRQPALPLFS